LPVVSHTYCAFFRSGLAVQPKRGDDDDDDGFVDAVFGRAEAASSGDNAEKQPRRTITMYRDGFVVDDGPYRRLDDPANADFLRSLAMGRAPAEFGGGDVSVGLIDKRSEEYVQTFSSFSGQGNSLGSSTTLTGTASSSASSGAMIEPSSLPSEPPAVDNSLPTTNIQVRLVNGQRRVITINTSSTVADLAAHVVVADNNTTQAFMLVSGFPPKPLVDLTQSMEEAGLKGAQVTQKRA
jgi:UBX domain-containing protein 1